VKRNVPTRFVALLRAVNVGGTGALPMKTLAELYANLGMENVRTYIQSGNVVFTSRLSKSEHRSKMEETLKRETGKLIDVIVRTEAELQSILAGNPFPNAKPSQVGVLFLSNVPTPGSVKSIVIPGREELRPLGGDVIVHYPDGMGRSKLKLAALGIGTVRNLNTVRKLAAL
jgi:uncharacterized protein (DUF1697 family)